MIKRISVSGGGGGGGGGGGDFHMYAYWVCAARETPIFTLPPRHIPTKIWGEYPPPPPGSVYFESPVAFTVSRAPGDLY